VTRRAAENEVEVEPADVFHGVTKDSAARCVRLLCETEDGIDLVRLHGVIEGREGPASLEEPVVDVDPHRADANVDVADQTTVFIENVVGSADARPHDTRSPGACAVAGVRALFPDACVREGTSGPAVEGERIRSDDDEQLGSVGVRQSIWPELAWVEGASDFE